MTKNLFLQDSNNNHNAKDSFGIHTKIAETITDIAKNETLLKSSFNLGLFGSWGSGKSYIVDKIISNLKEDYITFYVDVWKYVGHPLMRSILFDIDSQLKAKQLDVYKDGYIDKNKETLEKKLYAESEFNEEIKLDWQEIWQKIKPILISLLIISGIILIISIICYFNDNSWLKSLSIPIFSGLGFVTAPLAFVYLLKSQLKNLVKTVFCSKKIKTYAYKPTFSPEQFEAIFSDIVKNITTNKKMLIIFDNLDRCEPQYAYETLSAIKTFMDKEYCFYIIPCDDIAIKKYISLNYNIINNDNEDNNDNADKKFCNEVGDEFFDKLFNTYIRIPHLQEIDRDIFIEEQLKELSIYRDIETNISEIKQILFYGYNGATPRQIKRFINDFSLNYQLAQNIDPEHTFLLKDLTLFTVMMVIKQKWSNVESELIVTPDLFSVKNCKEYSKFINRVKNLLPKNIPSIMSFIYMKDAIDVKSISNNLKQGKLIQDINDNSVIIIKNEIQNMIDNNEKLYLQQTASSLFNILYQSKNLKENNKNMLIKYLGDILSLEDINFIDFINQNKTVIDEIVLYIKEMRDFNKDKVKQKISDVLRLNQEIDKNINKEQCLDCENKIKLFKNVLGHNEIIDNLYISKVFRDISEISQIDEPMQKYVEILGEQGKLSLIPSSFINLIIKSISKDSFSENVYNCLKNFNRKTLPEQNKKVLAQRLNTIISEIYSQINVYYNKENLLNGLNMAIKLIDDSSFDKSEISQFNNVLYNFIQNLMSYKPQMTMDFLIEALRFITVENDSSYDAILRKCLQPVDNQKIFANRLEELNNKEYVEKIIDCQASKQFLFNFVEIRKICVQLMQDSLSDCYEKLLREKDDKMDDLKTLLEIKEKYHTELNKSEFKTFIFSKYFNPDNLEKSYSLLELLNKYNIKATEQDFSTIKNSTLEAYKSDPKSGIRFLKIASETLTKKQFNKIFLSPLLKFINSELQATKSVGIYSNIVSIFNPQLVVNNVDILKELITQLLEDGQEANEYELAVQIINYLSQNSISVEEFKEIVQRKTNLISKEGQDTITEIYNK